MASGMYDIHAHLNDDKFIDLNETSMDVVRNARRVGVAFINDIGYDVKSSKKAIRQALANPGVFAVIGIHPNEAHLFAPEAIQTIADLSLDRKANKVVAIGEIGLDYERSEKYIPQQKEFFAKQIEVAQKTNLPIMLHIRDQKKKFRAYTDALEILKKYKVKHAVVHNFEATWEVAKVFVDHGYFISLGGLVTTEAALQEVAQKISLNSLMIESDAPNHPPIPYNKRKQAICYPEYLPIVAQKIAELRGTPVDEVVSSTALNAEKMFHVEDFE